jgi:hypothetical protein
MDLSLHNHPVIPLAAPLARAEGGDVPNRTLGSVLDVVAADGPRASPGVAQHVEEPEQAHRWPHVHVHVAEMHEDHHQREGVRR